MNLPSRPPASVPALVLACTLLFAASCSQDVATGRRCLHGTPGCSEDEAKDGGLGNANASTGGHDVNGPAENALSVHVEDVSKMQIEIVTLRCAGDCADVHAVARGGHPPYTFAWDDGSTSSARHVCLDASTTLHVSSRGPLVCDGQGRRVRSHRDPRRQHVVRRGRAAMDITDAQ